MVSRRYFLQEPLKKILGGSLPTPDATVGKQPGSLVINSIGGQRLQSIYDQYRSELFQRFLPAMDRYVIDPVHGGFMCDFNIRERVQLGSTKKTWSEGRGIWVYSFLFNHFGKDQRHLAVARKSADFILRHEPRAGGWWPASFTRAGELLPGAGDIYCDLYLAEGLAEFAQASGESAYREQARRLLLEAMNAYDSPGYVFPVAYGPGGAPPVSAPRVVGHWMVFLHAATVYLRYADDSQVQEVADRCIEALLHRHLNPDYGLLNETLSHDFTRPGQRWSSFAYLATAIQALWMVMQEALRRHNDSLFQQAAIIFKHHLHTATDAVYGGFFRSLDHIDSNTFKLDKVLSLQQEVLTGCLMLTAHTGDAYAMETFGKTYAYIREKFYHPDFAFVVESGDRQMKHWSETGVGNYHHPRHLMYTLLALKRLIANGGRVSAMSYEL